MTTIIDTIAKAHYVANEAQVEQLAHTLMLGEAADATYLRVLLAHMQGQLGKPRRGKQPPQEPVLDAIHDKLYPAALRGVGPAEMPQAERNRLGIRFRTNAATVRFFIRGGGDVRGVDVMTATKRGLRNAVKQETTQAVEGETRAQRAFRTAEAAVLRVADRLKRGDPDDARQRVETLMDELEKWLEALDKTQPAAQDHGATTTVVGARAPQRPSAQPAQLHRGA